VVFSPDGRLASGSHDHTVRLWDPATGALQQTLTGHFAWVLSLAFSPDGQLQATGSVDNTVRLWDPVTGVLQQILQQSEDHWNQVRSVAFSPDGRLLASGAGDHTVRLWDPATGVLQQTLRPSRLTVGCWRAVLAIIQYGSGIWRRALCKRL
jgi:WD40 repeat protein